MYSIKPCGICGKNYRPNSSRSKACSPKCHRINIRIIKRKYYKNNAESIYERQKKYLPKRLQRQIAMRLFRKLGIPPICQICGGKYRCQVHHKDLNPFNNSRDNLIMLCLWCHTKAHSL